MTTLTLTKQDGSPASGWAGVDGESETPVAVSSYEHAWLALPYSQAYMTDARFFVTGVGAPTGVRAKLNRLAPAILSQSEGVGAPTETQVEFDRLATEWKEETAHFSSSNMIAQHPAYQRIIGMGTEAIPLILQDLKETRAQWFWALRSIAGESPVLPKDRGDVDAMATAWLDWGKRRRYI